MQELIFLGTSGSVVTANRMCAGILFGDKLLDVGFGVLSNLLHSGLGLESINELYISHSHSDHIGDFTGLVTAMAMNGRTKPLRVVASESSATTLKKILELQSTPRKGFIRFEIIYQRPEDAGMMSIRTIHEPENLAYRFKNGGIDLVYSGDTARFQELSEFAKGSDLIIHDGTFLTSQQPLAELTNHSTAADAASVAKGARAKKLVLTHIAPANERAEETYLKEARRVFGGEVIAARDFLTLELGGK